MAPKKLVFGTFLRSIRKKRGWTLIQLAKRAHVEGFYVSMIERGVLVPRKDRIIRIAKALRMNRKNLLLRAWIDKAFPEIHTLIRRKFASVFRNNQS